MTALAQAILRTVCFADVLDAALSPIEIVRWLGVDQKIHASLADVTRALGEDDRLQSVLFSKDGFVCLRHRAGLIPERLERLAIAEEKWVIAMRAMQRLRYIPWLRLAAVCNTVAMGLPRRGSDIDVFLVAVPHRLWLVRLLAHGLLLLEARTRRGGRVQDAICLSFSITTHALALAPLAKKPEDPYLHIWLRTLVPVIDIDKTYAALLRENPSFVDASAVIVPAAPHGYGLSWFAQAVEHVCPESVALWLNRFARRVQHPRIIRNTKSRLYAEGTDVVVTDDLLKFHEEDKREAIRAAFHIRTARYGV
ncbi:hypothetical protein KBD18_01735 [Patescibacteria group bacterium]|nr:hypothetical protein [Patescibacteria group bacterium]